MTDDSRPADPLLDRKLHHSARIARCGARLHKLLEIRAPESIVRNDIRMIADDLGDLWVLVADPTHAVAPERARARKSTKKADD